MDLSKPDGKGELKISRMTIKTDSSSFDFEGQVEGYGSVFCSHELSYVGSDRSRGVLSGEARTFLTDGTLISTPHMGTFTREQSKVREYFTDAVNNGAINFVIWDIDLLSKHVDVSYWEIKAPN
ncbi:MAG: hypothetical protein P8N11_08640 [Gammaproteobacteria bacterium]|jgi:hypothetical protein|nr:hypothetical protein [Gammaproteobacteria bacterium]